MSHLERKADDLDAHCRDKGAPRSLLEEDLGARTPSPHRLIFRFIKTIELSTDLFAVRKLPVVVESAGPMRVVGSRNLNLSIGQLNPIFDHNGACIRLPAVFTPGIRMCHRLPHAADTAKAGVTALKTIKDVPAIPTR